MEEVNELPPDWVEHYTNHRFMLFDPVVRWAYGNVGTCRWSDLPLDDPKKSSGRRRPLACGTA
uniref:Autoinducer binding domain-containing protein n=1 Tax=Yoonia rhodophyticola TaxID=3137370 RepID=A0AAN0NHB7_9RHOB